MQQLDSFDTVNFDSPGHDKYLEKEHSRLNSQLSVRFSGEMEGSENFEDQVELRLRKATLIGIMLRMLTILKKHAEHLGQILDQLTDVLLNAQYVFEKNLRSQQKLAQSIKSKAKSDRGFKSQGIEALLLHICNDDKGQADSLYKAYKTS
jgi:hypothetical protein